MFFICFLNLFRTYAFPSITLLLLVLGMNEDGDAKEEDGRTKSRGMPERREWRSVVICSFFKMPAYLFSTSCNIFGRKSRWEFKTISSAFRQNSPLMCIQTTWHLHEHPYRITGHAIISIALSLSLKFHKMHAGTVDSISLLLILIDFFCINAFSMSSYVGKV